MCRCKECGSMMVVATRSRGIVTYRCPRGCNGSYQTIISPAPAADAPNIIVNTQVVINGGGCVQTAGT